MSDQMTIDLFGEPATDISSASNAGLAGVRNSGMGGHHSHRAMKDEWLTPPELLEKLGPFDLDPCAPVLPPWKTADRKYDITVDGLTMPWRGRVWCNPPYGTEAVRWLARLADHGNGIALIFARTETEMFFSQVWARATALLFIKGRIHFYHVTGERAKANSGAPSVLVAYGADNADKLAASGIDGQFIKLRAS